MKYHIYILELLVQGDKVKVEHQSCENQLMETLRQNERMALFGKGATT